MQQKILPSGYDYNVMGISLKEDGESPTEVKLDAKFRVNAHDEVMRSNLKSFLLISVKVQEQLTTKRTMQIGKKTALYGYRQCIHDVQNLENASKETMNDNKSGMNRESGKNTDCPAELNFSISTACATICVNKTTDAHKLRN